MTLKFLNTFTRKTEDFIPIKKDEVKLYTCGPTVYNYAHIGNFRAYIFEDLLRRTLKLNDFKVTQVMNLTDVDDKTIKSAIEKKVSLNEYTAPYKKAFFEDIDSLNIERAEHYPAATDHISDMIEMIEILIEKNFAYIADDNCIYYSIDKFDAYGCLANINRDKQISGVRIKNDEYAKESVSDFALWKAWDKQDGDVYWESPWGKGRPGWHIECSAMGKALLGKHFDIHTGGVDNMFPHHEDEIAQSEAANDCKFVNYWMHCAHLMVNGEKMSKSLGNFFTIPQLLEKGYSGREIRWVLLSTHYRQSLNFMITPDMESESIQAAKTSLQRIDNFIERVTTLKTNESINGTNICNEAKDKFRNTLNDDLNISGAQGVLFEFIRQINKIIDNNDEIDKKAILETCHYFNQILGVLEFESKATDIPVEISQMTEERQNARKNKDFTLSDELRDKINSAGWLIEDSSDGPVLKRKS